MNGLAILGVPLGCQILHTKSCLNETKQSIKLIDQVMHQPISQSVNQMVSQSVSQHYDLG